MPALRRVAVNASDHLETGRLNLRVSDGSQRKPAIDAVRLQTSLDAYATQLREPSQDHNAHFVPTSFAGFLRTAALMDSASSPFPVGMSPTSIGTGNS